ncbi:MucB/RseB C-terminal domain-containing protein [Aquincola sp. MAHUQ-54]|uniref:MucB/RseB C-terminal domain-containing protein n=1 Tax=Aquincola agrisoli TaxID=3119538 RepID=A0AAW9QBD9_9BURK
MRCRRLIPVAIVALSAAALGTAWAGPVSAPAAAASAPKDGPAWLARIHAAASQRNYQGTMVFTAGGAVTSSRIAHYCEGTNTYERIEGLDGERRQVLRHNDIVQTMWPGSRLAAVEQRDPLAPFPALLKTSEEQLFDRYELVAEGVDRVAGHDSLVFLLKPRDSDRFAQRLWADRGTGLLLRTDVLGAEDRVLESAAFTDLTIGVRPQPESVLKAMKKLDGYRVLRPVLTPAKLEAEGWSLKSPVKGFRQIRCVKRPLETPVLDQSAGADVLQVVYSDGLTHVSVFIEPFSQERHRQAVETSIGATHTLMQRHGDWWVTTMGDVPLSTLRKFNKALERR